MGAEGGRNSRSMLEMSRAGVGVVVVMMVAGARGGEARIVGVKRRSRRAA